MAEKRLCGTCGSEELLRGDGTVRTHMALRHGTQGVHRGHDRCTGSGEAPEPQLEEASLGVD